MCLAHNNLLQTHASEVVVFNLGTSTISPHVVESNVR
jgi:hypothetical protein